MSSCSCSCGINHACIMSRLIIGVPVGYTRRTDRKVFLFAFAANIKPQDSPFRVQMTHEDFQCRRLVYCVDALDRD